MSKETSLQKTSSSGPTSHSSLVGGSTADRRIGCPASYMEEQKVPAHIRNKSSSYADEGTALHAVMQHIFENDIVAEDLETELLGREFEGYVITQEHIDEAIYPCLDYIEALMDEYADEGEFRFELETRCAMPGIDGAFGTSDFIFRTDKRSGILDYKFGVRVPVKASYTVTGGHTYGNRQLSFYGRAAVATLPHMFEDRDDWPVELHILQPRAMNAEDKDKFTSYTSSIGELEAFRQVLMAAIDVAVGPGPTHTKGPWCFFAACKTVCPLHTGAMLNMAKIAVLYKNRDTVAFDFNAHLGALMEIWDIAKEAGAAVMGQAQKQLEAGEQIIDPETGQPGWKLVPKRGTETVVDEAGMVSHAKFVGVPDKEIYKPREPKSPAQLGKAMVDYITADPDGKPLTSKKAKEDEARRQLRDFTTNVSSGTNIARMDDKRPDVIPTPEIVNTLAAKLAHLNK